MKWYEKQKENFLKKVNEDSSTFVEDDAIETSNEDYIVEEYSQHNEMLNEIMNDSLRDNISSSLDIDGILKDEETEDGTIVHEEPVVVVATSKLTKGTKIEGNIISEDNLILEGELCGQVSCTQKVVLNGKLQGDMECANAVLNSATMDGNITSQGSVEVAQGCLVNGFVHAASLRCAGKIIGNINVSGTVVLESTGEINGDILAADFEIIKGAKIKGNVSID